MLPSCISKFPRCSLYRCGASRVVGSPELRRVPARPAAEERPLAELGA